MTENTRKLLKEQDEFTRKIWSDSELQDTLSHYHICDFELLSMLNRYKKRFSKFQKEWLSECDKYLHSVGESRDEYMSCCDRCPHMRYLVLNDENYFLNISTPGICFEMFEKEMENNKI